VIHAQSSSNAILVFCAQQENKPATSSTNTSVQGPVTPVVDGEPVTAEGEPAATSVVPVRMQPAEEMGASPKRQRLSHEEFHSSLR